jgi:membrane protein implicated in regulation of membrane protease activity
VARVQAMLAGVWEFVVGDDWPTALGAALAIALTALLADGGVAAWWVLPVTVLALLAWSVRRAARESTRR